MPVPRESLRDDRLIRHLLGALPEAEAQRLEEECIVDDALAERLQVAENELVDAYARGSLDGERRAQFESFYLASPLRRGKVAFAKRFVTEVDQVQGLDHGQPEPLAAPRRHPGGWFPWTLAAAAALFLATGMLLVRDARLRGDVTDARERLANAEHRMDAVSGALAEQQRATAAARQALAAATEARVEQPAAAIALLLMPQTRGVDPVPVLAVPAGAKALPLELKVQAETTARYSVALRDPANNGIVWRSPALPSGRRRRLAVVPVRLPALLLKAQHYALDLYEMRGSAAEFVGSYTFEIVRP